MWAGMLSGPDDLEESSVDSSFLTPLSEMVMLGNGGIGNPLHSGTWDRFS